MGRSKMTGTGNTDSVPIHYCMLAWMSSSLSAWRRVRLMMPYISMSMAFLLAGLFRVMSSTPSPLFSTKTFTIWKLKGVWHEMFDFRFFHESVSTGPLRIPFEGFRFFSKIRGDIREWMVITGVKRHRRKVYRSVIDTGDKHLFLNISANLRKHF